MPKLPPTDSRQRMDTRLWEENKLDPSNQEKNRLELNQRQRKKKLKEELSGQKLDVDYNYHRPVYFERKEHPVTGDTYYPFLENNRFGSNYWKDRELGSWDHLPRVFDDDCKPFH